MRSYSIVPSLIVQRKVTESDIADSLGGKWKDRLVAGIFGDNETEDLGSIRALTESSDTNSQ